MTGPGDDAAGPAEDGDAAGQTEDGDDVGRAEDGDAADPSDDAVDPADAFAALSDPIRVDILEALSDFRREGDRDVVGFADLRKRVGVRDSGRFRYHLNELRDRFVDRTDEGYRLTHAGTQVVAAIVAGTYTDAVSLGPAELDSECPACDEPAIASCEDGRCAVTCPNDHPLFGWSIPPSAAADASLPGVIETAELLAVQAIECSLAGVCPTCCADVDPRVTVGGERPGFRADCDVCGGRVVGPAGFCLLVDPHVRAFCRRHGRPLDDEHIWEPPFVADDSTVTVDGEDPIRVRFDVRLGGEAIRATVDESGQVTDVEYPEPVAVGE